MIWNENLDTQISAYGGINAIIIDFTEFTPQIM